MRAHNRNLLLQIMLLLLVVWQGCVIYRQGRMLREGNAEMRKATEQLNEDVRVMERLRKACHIEQAGWRE